MTILCCIGLQAFKYLLGILQNTGTLIQDNIGIITQFSFLPALYMAT